MIRSSTPSKTMRTGGDDDMCAWRVTRDNWLSQAGGIPKLSQRYEVDGYQPAVGGKHHYVRLKGEFVTLEALRSFFFENNMKEQRHSSELLGKGTQTPSPSPSPDPNPC